MNFFGVVLGWCLGWSSGLAALAIGPWSWAPHADPMLLVCPTELRYPSGWTPHHAGIPHKRQDSSQPRSTPQHHTANPPVDFYFFGSFFCCSLLLDSIVVSAGLGACDHHHHQFQHHDHNHDHHNNPVPLIHKVPKIASTSTTPSLPSLSLPPGCPHHLLLTLRSRRLMCLCLLSLPAMLRCHIGPLFRGRQQGTPHPHPHTPARHLVYTSAEKGNKAPGPPAPVIAQWRPNVAPARPAQTRRPTFFFFFSEVVPCSGRELARLWADISLMVK